MWNKDPQGYLDVKGVKHDLNDPDKKEEEEEYWATAYTHQF